MTELELIVEFHKQGERQGPGSEQATLKALSMMDLPSGELTMADIGCGTGSSALILASKINGHIKAIDLFPGFLSVLEDKARKSGLEDQIETIEMSMDKLTFNEKLDIIWSEGSIYNIGFEAGIKEWRKHLKSGGYLAVSEVTWTSHTRPHEIQEFWTKGYPEIGLASTKIKILEDNGFIICGYFYLDEESWMKNYYEPMEQRIPSFLNQYGSENTSQFIASCKQEIALFRKYKNHYNYGFYVARKES